MTAKEYLWRVRDAERDLRSTEMDYQRARNDVRNLRAIEYDKDRVGSSCIGDLSDAIVALEKYASRVSTKWQKMIALCEEATALIGQVDDWRYREVLKRRYLQGQTWEQIAVSMGYSERQVLRIHGRALRSFGEKMS